MECDDGNKGVPVDDEVLLFVSRSRQEKVDRLVRLLRVDARMPLMEMSRRTGIPVSTIFDLLNEVRRLYELRCVFIRRADVVVGGGA